MDGEALYDEFGNYIGSEFSSESDDGGETTGEGGGQNLQALSNTDLARMKEHEVVDCSTDIVLHEDKNYYASTHAVFGEGVEALTMEDDSQSASEPLVAPLKEKSFGYFEGKIPELKYTSNFLTGFMGVPELNRDVSIIGHFHSGKTTFLDMLIESTHADEWTLDRDSRYTDTRRDEQARKMSLKSTPVSLVLRDLRSKSHLFNLIDCPGHVSLCGETTAAMRISDGAIVVVDAVEGVLMQTKKALHEAAREDMPVVLVINKFDRLITELKLPPADCYHKVADIIAEVNDVYNGSGYRTEATRKTVLCPKAGNVLFASPKHRWAFSLLSFAQMYSKRYGSVKFNVSAFAQRLWGDVFFDETTRKFVVDSDMSDVSAHRTFVSFVLDPIYKLYAHIIGEEKGELSVLMADLGIHLKKDDYKLDPHPLLRRTMKLFFKDTVSCIADALVSHVPSPIKGCHKKILRHYTSDMTSEASRSMLRGDSEGPLVVNIVKHYPSADGSTFLSFGRIYSGTIVKGDRVRVLRENYGEDEEDSGGATVSAISIGQAHYRIYVNKATVGSLVFIEGIHHLIAKTATLTHTTPQCDYVKSFAPLNFVGNLPTLKVAVEPLKPSQLPKLVEGLRGIGKTFPLVSTKVEESGEHIIFGTGELQLDVVLHDLRICFSDIEVKVSDPSTCFRETIVDTSFVKCNATSANGKNSFSMVADRVSKGLVNDIEAGRFTTTWSPKKMSVALRKRHGWDALASRSVWAFGPGSSDSNILIDDTLPCDVDKPLLNTVRGSIVQGFRWAAREGPLCDEPMREVKFKLIDAFVSNDAIHRGGGQIVPASRRVANSAFLNASPRLMEPTFCVEILAFEDTIGSVYKIVSSRRGKIINDHRKPGTPFRVVIANIPAIECFGLETDLRLRTQGQAFCMQTFDHWSVVPGDPLDDKFIVVPLESAPREALARDFMIKTRRRKGLGDDVLPSMYFD